MNYFLPVCGFLLLVSSCKSDKVAGKDSFVTQNVVVIVVDGPRYTETWGDSTHANIPNRYALLAEGVLADQFFNNGNTITNPGHIAISSGNYDYVANDGSELPHFQTLFQAWLNEHPEEDTTSCCFIASKDKLHILANDPVGVAGNRKPYSDCGVNGNGTGGYRSDSVTQAHVLTALQTLRPRLMLVNFKDPDSYGHMGDFSGYLAAIQQTDAYVAAIWNYLQSDPFYKDKTTLIVTNDHGRHTNGISTGFTSHGDGCEGCRRIEFFALSPDFKQGAIVFTPYEQTDISATIAKMLGLPFPSGSGEVMTELFR